VRLQIPVDAATVPRIPAVGALVAEGPDGHGQPPALAPTSGDEAVSGRAWRALAVAALGTVLVGFNSTATNIALNDIRTTFAGASAAEVGWGVAGYLIGTAAFLPLGGRLADRLGRKRVFQSGLLLFAISAVLSAIAPTVWTLNLARVLQAVAGAAVLPASLSLVLPLFPESRRTTAVGLWSAAGPLAAAVAPVGAALILGVGGWRTVYLVSAPMALAMFAMGALLLDELPTPKVTSRLDLLGASAGTLAIACIVAALMQGGTQWGMTSPITLAVGSAGVTALAIFVANSLRHPEPLLNLRLLRLPGVRVANLANFLIGITSLSIWLVWPLFLREVWQFSNLGVGLGLTVGPIAAGTSTLVFSRIGDRIGPIALCRLGAALQTFAVAWHFTHLDHEVNFWVDFVPGIALYGIGWGMSTPLLNSIALSWVDEKFYGETNGLFNTLRYVAAALGTAAVFALLIDRGADDLADYDSVLFFFVMASLAGFVSLWLPGARSRPSS